MNRNRFDKPDRKGLSSLPADVFVVEGLAAVREYLRHRPRMVVKALCKRDGEKSLRASLQELDCSVVPVEVLKDDADPTAATAPIWAHVRHQTGDEKNFIERLAGRETDLVVALDHVTDPRNVGAIVRTAAFFGVKDVLAPERRQGLITPASVATAQGGFALCDLVKVVNLNRVLDKMKEAGYWVVGTDMDGDPIETCQKNFGKTVIVMGSEDSGMSAGIRKACDLIVRIGAGAAGGGLESLNVSVAAGIFIHAFSPGKTSRTSLDKPI